ncbi:MULTISPECIES: class I SAM-dependent methyltransferase [unclassified Roseitalea]|uniref:class I SAM-dependent methyltransferase n=1 Tax=unclassified Roseitalea TaxID=2639107 RepID=UPI00273E672B|nr:MULTISPECIES: class I SAM-dependent methyltransferase [unclassified Roseitalea]
MHQSPLGHTARADLDFVLAWRRRWADTLFPELDRQVRENVGDGLPADRKQAMSHVRAQPVHTWFGWSERASQKALWRAVSDAVANNPPILLPEEPAGSLTLDPDLELPQWYTEWDIHVQPGGVWRADESAYVYELGAKLVMMGDNDDYAFHRRFVETCAGDLDKPTRLVDMGCGFGKSTWPLKQAYPDAEVIGVDLAAPCLRLAHAKTEALGLAVHYRQGDVTANTGLEAGKADLVTATMLIHELPQPALRGFFAEAARLLKPGGRLRVLDFQFTGDPVRDTAVMDHGARNNEPFMPGMMASDTCQMARDAGFAQAGWVAFDERGTGRLDGAKWPKRAEWHFPWAVLEAEMAQ